MSFRFNPFTGGFDLVAASSELDLSGLQAEIDALDGRVSDLESDVADLQTYSQTFTAIAWSGPVDNEYSLTIPFANHGKTNPFVQIFELVVGEYQLVECFVNIDASNNVTISVNQVPDLRFNGKIIIS